MKKRILIFSTAYLPLIGGAEIAVKEITDRLPGFEFVMITAKLKKDLADTEQIGNISVHRIGKGNAFDKYRLIVQGWKKARELGSFDMVWSIMASYAGFTALRFKKRNPKVPFLLTLQEGDSRWDIYKHVWWCWSYFTQIFKQADKIQAISTYLAKWAKELGATCPIEVVPNGVDDERFKIKDLRLVLSEVEGLKIDSGKEIKDQLKISEKTKLVITVSRLVKKNAVSDLIKAMKFLDSNAHLLIVGDGELKNQLVLLANQLGVISRIHFIGYLNHEELLSYLQASDIFCRPSLSEGLGNAFLEAMAVGVPVIGTKVGGIPDFLKDGETGWFCEVKNPKSIAEKILYVTDEKNKDMVNKVILEANKMVLQKYFWQSIANQMNHIFETL